VSSLVVNLDLPGGRSFMPLFVQLTEGTTLDGRIQVAIRDRLRQAYSPRHVPDRIVQVAAIPMTRTGKKMEIPVRRFLLGSPLHEIADPNVMADPAAMDDFRSYRDTQTDYPLG
jgi:acetoacetyl-CoA synthetase